MIKGIYNENEFYTNFYWDSRFVDDLRLRIGDGPEAQDSIGALKELDAKFWALTEKSEDGSRRIDGLFDFYRSLFRALGYKFDVREHQTSSGHYCSLVAQEEGGDGPELFAVLLDQDETGIFEAPPLFVNIQSDGAKEAFDGELSELLHDEFQNAQKPPRWILVGAPNALFVVERNKWSFGRYLRVDWKEVFLQRDLKPYEFLYGIASKKLLCSGAGRSLHDEFDDNSHRHAFEITTELRESVREVIELLINEMIDLKKEAHQKIFSSEKSKHYATELTHDALYYAYRLLFLLYLEAQGDDSELLPLKSEIYRSGYSLEKLLELDFVDVAPGSAESGGTFLFESLEQIFNLIYFGFEPAKEGIFNSEKTSTGFLVKGIKSDLFDPTALRHLRGVKLRNGILLEVLKKLSLTRKKERGGKARARVSYANLGINQLGAVYEGLLSYTGFFAQEDLHALKPASVKQAQIDNGSELDQVYLSPRSIVERYRKASEKKYKLTDENAVVDESGNPKIYKKGSFVYRLAGRDRQKLASYYTPESLTKCTVKYSLKVLFESKTTLAELWDIKILEPAMGSGAFLNEAVNQIADRILELEVQQGAGDLKTPRAKKRRLSDIKYRLIANNVYGVDLNPTAIELARFSLWLNCIGAGKEPPAFDGRLKVGNSLVGARFSRGAAGIFPWLQLDDGMLNYGKTFRDYDRIAAEQVKNVRADFLGSQLKISDNRVVAAQEDAEKQLHLLLNGTDDEKSEAYRRLRLACDLWCAIFFATAKEVSVVPPTHEAYLSAVRAVLTNGTSALESKLESFVLDKRQQEQFFHWDIEYPEIIRSGGFDLILGNPPWVAVEWKDSLFVSDFNAVPSVLELNAADTRTFVSDLDDRKINQSLADEFIRIEGYSNLLEVDFYRLLSGVAKNTYKAFDVLALYLLKEKGAFGIIQEDGILEDKNSSNARGALYRKFRYHFQFQNEKFLFAEVGHAKRFSVNVFSGDGDRQQFDHIGNVFLPSTIDECFSDDNGSEPLPLIKDAGGNWETRGHRNRVVRVDKSALSIFARFLNEENDETPRFLNLHSSTLFSVLRKIADCEDTIESVAGGPGACVGSEMLNETSAQDKGFIYRKSERPKSIDSVVLSGPHIVAGNPLSQETLTDFKSKFSYESVDLTAIKDDFVQRTIYQLEISQKDFDELLPKLDGKNYRSLFRLVTRNMINPTNERCMFTCIIPPGVAHINTLNSFTVNRPSLIPVFAGLTSSLLIDGLQRLMNRSHFFSNDFKSVPVGPRREYFNSIGRRALVLNGLTKFYGDLWKACGEYASESDSLLNGHPLTGFGSEYRRDAALRSPQHREQAAVEIDALVALNFNLNEDELVQIYEILFPVLVMSDQGRGFGRKSKMIEAYRAFKDRGW